MRASLILLLAAQTLAVLAQAQDEPPVRRALPANEAAPTPRPEPPTPPAVPFESQTPPRAEPAVTPDSGAAKPEVTPYRPPGRVRVSPTPAPEPSASPAEDGSIRLAPSAADQQAPDQAQLAVANSLYGRKMYDLAIVEYEKFLISYAQAAGRDMALFRLAESHRMLGNEAAARAGYEKLMQEFRQGEFAGAGAYRLGEILYANKLYDAAAGMFQIAAENAASADVKLSARFNMARSLDHLQRTDEAAALYQELAATPGDNPYRDISLLALADAEAKRGKKKEALAAYEKLSDAKAKVPLRAEAAVKAAALAAELDQPADAARLFQKALKFGDIGDWKPPAIMGLMKVNFRSGNYQAVTETSQELLDSLPEDSKPEALLLLADSFRLLHNDRAARAVYDRLSLKYPKSEAAGGAQFSRLVSLYQLNDENLLPEVDKFLTAATDPRQRNQAFLMKAETLFKRQEYAEAAKIYQTLLDADLPKDYRQETLFKLGWCQAQSGQDTGAIKTLSDYLAKYPDGSAVPSAILQRGMARMREKDFAGAIKDFDTLIGSHRGASERELALQYKALILGQQQDYKAMTEAFQTLLNDYPKSAGAGQANFWIGRAAYEKNQYAEAIPFFEAARKLDAKNYGERATLHLMLCRYNTQDRPALAAEVDAYRGASLPQEILTWLGDESFKEGDYRAAEKYFRMLVERNPNATAIALIQLAESQIRLGKHADARKSAEKCLPGARDPATRARCLIVIGDAQREDRNFEEAKKSAEEALLLQPEGRYNAEARLLAAEIDFSERNYDAAARGFMSIAVLYEDKDITPRALQRAAKAYRLANNIMEAQKAENELRQRFPEFDKSPKLSKGTQ